MKQPIKQGIREIYRDIGLSDDELATLREEAFQEAESNKGKITENQEPLWFRLREQSQYWLVAVCCMVCIVGALLLSPLYTSSHTLDDIVADAIDNHLLNSELAHPTESIGVLGQVFKYLGFAPVNLPQAQSLGQLMGGTPCFILDMPAAQLRYQAANNAWATVFQTRYKQAMYGDIPEQRQAYSTVKRGLNVSVWVDNEVLFVTVTP